MKEKEGGSSSFSSDLVSVPPEVWMQSLVFLGKQMVFYA